MADKKPTAQINLTANELKLLARSVAEQIFRLQCRGFRYDDTAMEFLDELHQKLINANQTLKRKKQS
ncbi:MAG: hypothetical protein KDB00_24450 [Planctomycetales bacterium]|nr:hypothetical protein [Planctomycetales bacterium]